jgi:hypothetical protein
MTLTTHSDNILMTPKTNGEDTLMALTTSDEDTLTTLVMTCDYLMTTPHDVTDNPCDDIDDLDIHRKAYGRGRRRPSDEKDDNMITRMTNGPK